MFQAFKIWKSVNISQILAHRWFLVWMIQLFTSSSMVLRRYNGFGMAQLKIDTHERFWYEFSFDAYSMDQFNHNIRLKDMILGHILDPYTKILQLKNAGNPNSAHKHAVYNTLTLQHIKPKKEAVCHNDNVLQLCIKYKYTSTAIS